MIQSENSDREAMKEMEIKRKERQDAEDLERIRAQAHAQSMNDIYGQRGSDGFEEDDDEVDE